MTFDPDLEAKTRSSLMSILDGSFPGEGASLWRGVLGLCPGRPEGGEWVEGASGTQHLSPVLGGAGYRVLPWSDPMIRVVGLWNPLLIWAGPGPPNLSYIHIRLIDEALFQSLHRPFRCGRHTVRCFNANILPA